MFFSGYVASHTGIFTGDVRRCLDEGTSGESRQLKRRVCAKSNKGNPTQTNEHYSLTCPYQSSLSNGKFLKQIYCSLNGLPIYPHHFISYLNLKKKRRQNTLVAILNEKYV